MNQILRNVWIVVIEVDGWLLRFLSDFLEVNQRHQKICILEGLAFWAIREDRWGWRLNEGEAEREATEPATKEWPLILPLKQNKPIE